MTLLNKIGHVLTADITKDFKLKKKPSHDAHELTFIDQLKKRRSIYALGKRIHFSQTYMTELIQEAVRSCPSAHHSQSTRVVILFSESHKKFWNLVQEVQRQFVPEQVFAGTKMKIEQCAAGFGTVLFYEDQQVIRQLQKKIPFNAAEFPIWSEQTSGMAQFAVWTALADSGVGASLQHYNPNIDRAVAEHFDIPDTWLLRSQLVFGSIEEEVTERSHAHYQNQFKVYA